MSTLGRNIKRRPKGAPPSAQPSAEGSPPPDSPTPAFPGYGDIKRAVTVINEYWAHYGDSFSVTVEDKQLKVQINFSIG